MHAQSLWETEKTAVFSHIPDRKESGLWWIRMERLEPSRVTGALSFSGNYSIMRKHFCRKHKGILRITKNCWMIHSNITRSCTQNVDSHVNKEKAITLFWSCSFVPQNKDKLPKMESWFIFMIQGGAVMSQLYLLNNRSNVLNHYFSWQTEQSFFNQHIG